MDLYIGLDVSLASTAICAVSAHGKVIKEATAASEPEDLVRALRDLPGTVIGVGLVTEAQQAEEALQNGDADLIAIARAVLYNPHWPWHAAAALGAQVSVPPQYLRSEPHGLKGTLKSNR